MSEIRNKITNLKQFMESRILGQEALVRKLIISMLADGHVLVEGAPGLAKTKAIKTLSECIDALYSRIQFTPDLLPSDITGSDIIYISAKELPHLLPGCIRFHTKASHPEQDNPVPVS